MDYFSKFLRSSTSSSSNRPVDHYEDFVSAWTYVQETLTRPDERQLAFGIKATKIPDELKRMLDALVGEQTRVEEGMTGACMEHLLENDVLGALVRLSEPDRPAGIQAEVLRAVQNMVVYLDEQFLVHSVVHRAVLKLLKTCVGDDIQEQLDGRSRLMGAARNVVRTSPSEYEEDLVEFLCLLCSRIRAFRELLMIFFYDKHWYHTETLSTVPEEEEEDSEEDDEDESKAAANSDHDRSFHRTSSPTPSQETVTSAPASSAAKKPEYEFLLFNYLLRFVHREGKIGDLARAGLLFIMDVAMSPGVPVNRLAGDDSSLTMLQNDPVADAALALAEYILDGDFCEVLGAGLGAVYSLLPSKLEIRYDTSQEGSNNSMVIGSSGPMSEEEKENEAAKREEAQSLGLESSSSVEFKTRLDHFVKLLEFLQDVIRRNHAHSISPPELSLDDSTLDASAFVGTAIVQAILDAVRRIFLENVLYPSILECSDMDGSSVAVLSYIDVVVRTLSDVQFAETFIDFLVSEDDNAEPSRWRRTRPEKQRTLLLDSQAEDSRSDSAPPLAQRTSKAQKIKRRKSSAMMLLEMDAPDARKQTGYLTAIGRFTLKDLLLTNVRSKSHTAATAAFQLMQTLLGGHCVLAVTRLFLFSFEELPEPSGQPTLKIEDDDDPEEFVYPGVEDEIEKRPLPSFNPSFKTPDATYSVHERELELYLGLASRIDPAHKQDAFSTGYEHYLRDAISLITSHSCFVCAHDLFMEPHAKHVLNPNDSVLSLVLEALTKFYTNSPEMNVSLVGMLAAIAVCPERSLQGWLFFDSNALLSSIWQSKLGRDAPMVYTEDGDDRSIDCEVSDRLAARQLQLPMISGEPPGQPVVYSILKGLVKNLDLVRGVVENFDAYLAERRQGLLFSENLTDALNLSFDTSTGFLSGLASGSPAPGAQTGASPAQETPSKPKPKARSTWSSLLTPRSRRTKESPRASPGSSRPTTPPSSKSKTVEASPFGAHYQKTLAIQVEPTAASVPSSGSWTPVGRRPFSSEDDDDVFGSSSQWEEGNSLSSFSPSAERAPSETTPKTITLSQLLDNAVILEESIKEMAALIHARRALGMDTIRYL